MVTVVVTVMVTVHFYDGSLTVPVMVTVIDVGWHCDGHCDGCRIVTEMVTGDQGWTGHLADRALSHAILKRRTLEEKEAKMDKTKHKGGMKESWSKIRQALQAAAAKCAPPTA